MKKAALLVVGAMLLMALTGGGVFARGYSAQTNTVTIQLNEQNGSGQNGTATLTESGGMLLVSINISNGTSTPQPAHIHQGTCANLNPKPLIPLTNVVNGASDSTINLSTTS